MSRTNTYYGKVYAFLVLEVCAIVRREDCSKTKARFKYAPAGRLDHTPARLAAANMDDSFEDEHGEPPLTPRERELPRDNLGPVSYTHLTLPTILRV